MLDAVDENVPYDKGGSGSSVMVHVPCVTGGLVMLTTHTSMNKYGTSSSPVHEMFPKGCTKAPKPSPPSPEPPSTSTPTPVTSDAGSRAVAWTLVLTAATAAWAFVE